MEPPRALLSTLWNHPDSRLTERDLTLLWTDFIPLLERIDRGGSPSSIRVLDPGDPDPAEGPDLKDVRLVVDGVRRSGSVEIHRQPSDWYRHGHHRDPAYNTVILHVCLRPGTGTARRQDGHTIPMVPLMPHLDELKRIVRGTLGPDPETRRRAIQRPCFRPSIRQRTRYRRILESSARSWLARRAGQMRGQPREHVLFQGLVESLGYGGNHDTFRRLARRLDPGEVYVSLRGARTTNQVEGYLMGVGGWLPRPFRLDVNRSMYRRRRRWENRWNQERPRIRDVSSWNRGGVRPQAFPLRRWLCFGWGTRRLGGPWRSWIAENLRPLLREESIRPALRRRVVKRLRFPRGNYWRHHYTRCDDYTESVAAPLGAAWVDQMVVNVLFPHWYLQSLRRGDETLRRRVWEHFFTYPPVLSNRRTRRVLLHWGLQHDFSFNSVAEQQGAVLLYKRGCRRTRCERCPLGERPDAVKRVEGEKSKVESF